MKETSGAETFDLVSLFSDTPAPSLSLPQSTRTDLANCPSSTTNSSNQSWKDPTMDNTQASTEISRQSIAAILGSVSGAGLVFAVILVFHRFFYQPFNKPPKLIRFVSPERESGPADERLYAQLSGGKEISRFSTDS
ncbi:hypothetical protein POX_c04594 [Penicillium oxalicum]|uniref:hypothetical protein n=1 Tax=Penicillium oxalicum TaxID=69781 RepID=UPI0020B65F02|nr:hypothetical protein POX_c04594 [Penicillium oxalicum]KAI2791719.1 hypothetical protein POX_c04594 [Penicillium oxalicum]